MSDIEAAIKIALSQGFETPIWMCGKGVGQLCKPSLPHNDNKFKAFLVYKPVKSKVDIAINLVDENYRRVLSEDFLWEIVAPGLIWSVQYKLPDTGKDRKVGVTDSNNFTLFLSSGSKKYRLDDDFYYATVNSVEASTYSDRA